jgi:hypothetical protein
MALASLDVGDGRTPPYFTSKTKPSAHQWVHGVQEDFREGAPDLSVVGHG